MGCFRGALLPPSKEPGSCAPRRPKGSSNTRCLLPKQGKPRNAELQASKSAPPSPGSCPTTHSVLLRSQGYPRGEQESTGQTADARAAALTLLADASSSLGLPERQVEECRIAASLLITPLLLTGKHPTHTPSCLIQGILPIPQSQLRPSDCSLRTPQVRRPEPALSSQPLLSSVRRSSEERRRSPSSRSPFFLPVADIIPVTCLFPPSVGSFSATP